MPYPLSYTRSNFQAEARAKAVMDHIHSATIIVLVAAVCVLAFNLTTSRHKLEAMEATCPR